MNIPEHEPHVGHAADSTALTSSSETFGSADTIIASIRSTLWSQPFTRPASIGPPDTKITGMFKRIAAINIPGVTLSQFEIHTRASALCAFTIYSTESAIISLLGKE